MPFPLAFEKDISKPTPVKFKKDNLVLWKSKNKVICMPDRCPHRYAKLSNGVIHNNKLECPYHGWTFTDKGKCVHIPQLPIDKKIPKACNSVTFPVTNHDGIIWFSDYNGIKELPVFEKEFKKFYLTDKSFYLPYSYQLQIENLLDPAHLHFVHDGFQGNRDNACPIKLTSFYENDKEIYGYFVHLDNTTPDLSIRFIKPGIVDVSVINKDTHKLIRKNVIYVSPALDNSCNVLFRDITMADTFFKMHENTIFKNNLFESKYKQLNTTIIDLITDQDVKIIKSQSENITEYNKIKYVLPAEADRMIVAFRKWYLKSVI